MRLMFDLAVNYGQGVISLSDIATRQDISLSYLEKLALGLRKAGLIVSERGAQGGYQLSRSPDSITVGEILLALEGPIAIAKCLEATDRSDDCHCVHRMLFTKINDSIKHVVDNLTLQDMKDEYFSDMLVDGISEQIN